MVLCRRLRERVYKTLAVWLQVVGSLCGCSSNSSTLNDLLAEIFFDISQQQPEALQVPVKCSKKPCTMLILVAISL